MRFASPWFLLLLILLVPLIYFEFRKRYSAIVFSDISFLKSTGLRGKVMHHLPAFLNMLVLILFAVSLARPQEGRVYEEIETRGVDILLCLDISTSMRAEDFQPKNRLHVAKERAKEFIEKRKGDRIGLVVFAADALTQCPLTLDHLVLKNLMDYVDFGLLEDGTAIGAGLATAVNRLKNSRAQQKTIILLTDGVNNRGEIDPASAAKIAQAFGIRVYCIGVGTKGLVPYPVDHQVFGRTYTQVEIDFDMDILNEIANITGGHAFLASDAAALRTTYEEIDKMEPTTFKMIQHTVHDDKAADFMRVAVLLFLGNMVFSFVFLRRLP
ncbi:MAG: VWA domain-containing protein [candidate division WOR-3 bacterium]|nr:MAG: VWA domain-containing protein [candidate division WOR-3 bacterium]